MNEFMTDIFCIAMAAIVVSLGCAVCKLFDELEAERERAEDLEERNEYLSRRGRE